jgi:hypothetical protein
VGNLLLGATVTVRFPLAAGGTVDVTGVVGAGPTGAPAAPPAPAVVSPPIILPLAPALPPPLPPVGALPPPPPLAPPFVTTAPRPFAEVPVIPEAGSLALLGLGLGALGGLHALRRRRRRP